VGVIQFSPPLDKSSASPPHHVLRGPAASLKNQTLRCLGNRRFAESNRLVHRQLLQHGATRQADARRRWLAAQLAALEIGSAAVSRIC